MKKKIKFKLTEEEKKEKNNEKIKKEREQKKSKGYKFISFQIEPNIYKKIKEVSEKENLTIKETIILMIKKY